MIPELTKMIFKVDRIQHISTVNPFKLKNGRNLQGYRSLLRLGRISSRIHLEIE